MVAETPEAKPEGHLFDGQVCHSLDRLDVIFDDGRLGGRCRTAVGHLGPAPGPAGAARPPCGPGRSTGTSQWGHKAMTLIHSALAGGDSIDDADALRAGETEVALGHVVLAPSTLGTFLRSFTWGHARQLDTVSGLLLARAWSAGAGPGDEPFTIDVDSSIHETYGLAKQGGTKFTYNHVRGYHPLYAVAAATGEVLHTRLRGGNAHAGRGAAGFLTETFTRVRMAGAAGPIVLRADSGFYNHNVVEACTKADVRFSITAKLYKGKVTEAIAAIDSRRGHPSPTSWTAPM